MAVRLRLTPQGWKESDLAFEQWGDQKITVYYTNPALKMNAQIAYHTLKKAAAKLQKRLAWQPQKMEVKLYHDPEWFRQSVKPYCPGGLEDGMRQSVHQVSCRTHGAGSIGFRNDP